MCIYCALWIDAEFKEVTSSTRRVCTKAQDTLSSVTHFLSLAVDQPTKHSLTYHVSLKLNFNILIQLFMILFSIPYLFSLHWRIYLLKCNASSSSRTFRSNIPSPSSGSKICWGRIWTKQQVRRTIHSSETLLNHHQTARFLITLFVFTSVKNSYRTFFWIVLIDVAVGRATNKE